MFRSAIRSRYRSRLPRSTRGPNRIGLYESRTGTVVETNNDFIRLFFDSEVSWTILNFAFVPC